MGISDLQESTGSVRGSVQLKGKHQINPMIPVLRTYMVGYSDTPSDPKYKSLYSYGMATHATLHWRSSELVTPNSELFRLFLSTFSKSCVSCPKFRTPPPKKKNKKNPSPFNNLQP